MFILLTCFRIKLTIFNSHPTSWQFFAKEFKNRLLKHITSLDLENPP